MFERALTYLEINKERIVRLGAKVKPPYDLDTIEGQIWRQPHVCDIIVLSHLAEYGSVENPRTGRTVQGIRYTGQPLPLDAGVSPKEIIQQSMVVSDNIEHSILNYYSKTQQDPHHRYRSWEHCYLFFQKHRPFCTADIKDLANLHLAFFLASWGMYSGKTFLLWKDYRIFDPIVDALIDPEYETLYHLDPAVLYEDSNVVSLVVQLAKNLSDIFTKTVHIVDGRSRNIEVTATLVTKILLGTMACTPAYDRYVIAGLGKHGFMHCRFTQASYRELLHFYRKNSNTFNRLHFPIPNSNFYYPPMKLVDMYFWSIGFEKAGKLNHR